MNKGDTAWRKYRSYQSGKNCEIYKKLKNTVSTMILQMNRITIIE